MCLPSCYGGGSPARSTLGFFGFWLLAAPFGLGIVSEVLFQYSWWLALRKSFRYDYERREATWLEAGERRTNKYLT